MVGEGTTCDILARMKVLTRGRYLGSRTIGATVVGQGIDSLIFISLAFGGTDSPLIRLILTQWTAKVIYETAVTPLTYVVIGWLKRREGFDHYDYDTSFNPIPLLRGG